MAELEKRQRRNVMTYITSFERHGLRKGMRKGLRQGLRQGRQEGRQEGRVVALRELVREALEARFGVVSAEDGDRIESECDPEVLRRWHRRAITVSSTDQVWS
jgi:flagellar biosynthesis/type III secretory pathway protein FliH